MQIDIRRGTYHEIGYLTGKPKVTLLGEDRAAMTEDGSWVPHARRRDRVHQPRNRRTCWES
jgi:hypothetical protein